MGTTEMKVGADGVALITIINPPVNSLSFDVLFRLKDNYEQALRRHDVKAIVITGSEGKFSGGFDITAFGGMQGGKNKQPKRGCISMDVFTNMFEGTQRLPHLVGLSKALEMMLMSKPVKAEEAQALGLVDAIVPSDELVMTASRWALDIVEHRKPWIITLYRSDKLEPVGEAREILKFAKAQAHRQAPNLQHPLVCIDVIEEGVISGPHAGLWKTSVLKVYIHCDGCKQKVKRLLQNI